MQCATNVDVRSTFSYTAAAAAFEKIDGKVVYSSVLEEALDFSEMRDRIQPNGDVLPVWKVFTGSLFSDYRYRRLVK